MRAMAMYWKWSAIFSIVFSVLALPLFSQSFPCDGSMLFSYNQETAPTQLSKVYLAPFGSVYFSPIKLFPGGEFNALGFNPKDNYIYGVQKSSDEIVRLKANGSFDVLGSVPEVGTLNSNAGDCTPDGFYLCHDNTLDQILVFDVVDDFELINRVDLFWDPETPYTGPFTARINDFAIDPNNPTVAYTFQGNYFDTDLQPAATRKYLFKINLDFNDPNLGMVTPIGPVSTPEIRKMGSLFFTQDGRLFAYGSVSLGSEIKQNKYISIDKNTGDTFVYVASGPSAISSDGCSCPYSMTFALDAQPRDVLCSNSNLTYAFTINNRFYQELTDVVLIDTLPEGMVIENVTGNFIGNHAPGTGMGTKYLNLTGITIPQRGVLNINVNVRVDDVQIGFIDNQAFLKNLPERFGEMMISDDPQTTGFIGDPTTVSFTPQRLNEFELTVTPPTNCLFPNDAQVLLSSPLLIAGEQYQVHLRDQDYQETDYQVTIDNANSFLLDNMAPGEYNLFKITANSSECSFSMKDTTINIIPPNEQLQATAVSNSPLCAAMSLQFTGQLFPGGSVNWSGPQGFVSADLEPVIPAVSPEQSGTYEMIATYGVCEQIRTLEVEVAPEIEAAISGATQVCERAVLQLEAIGEGDLQTFEWVGPADLTTFEQTLTIPSTAFENEGQYQVIIDNGYCVDTASTTISVLTSPSISLPSRIETDFCDPLPLTPAVTGGNNLIYSWAPAERLSCHDCPNPEVVLPLLPSYTLKVSNEFSCQDSTVVNVTLSEDKLIYIPNAFSPNLDGNNDYFELFPGCAVVAIKKLNVFDRWGSVVYSAGPLAPQRPSSFWDGRVGNELGNAGTYMWQVEIELVTGEIRFLYGGIDLMR